MLQSARRNLLLFGINYEPEPTGTALNTTWWTETLVGLGWDVSVVTGIPHYPSWRPGKVAAKRRHGSIQVRHRRHYVPHRQGAARRGLYELTWLLSALPELRRPRRVDAVLGVVPSLGGAVLAAAAAKRYDVPYGLLFQDLVGRAADQSGIPGGSRVAGAVEAVELALARNAAGVAIVADAFRGYFLHGGVEPARIHRVRNPARLAPVRDSRETVRSRLGWPPGEFIVVHSGSMGHKQGLETVLAAADLAGDDAGIRFVFQGDGNQREELERRAHRLRLSNVSFLPLASSGDLGNVLSGADALLLNQRGSVRNMSMPAKLASYFVAGVAVIGAVADDDESAAEIAAAGGGLIVPPDDAEALLAAVRRLRMDPAFARRLGDAGRRFASERLEAGDMTVYVDNFMKATFSGEAGSTYGAQR